MMRKSSIGALPEATRKWLDRALMDSNFSGYQQLEELLREKGFSISKSSIHRYGQDFERRLSSLKLATEQARAVVDAAPDREGAVNEALMRMVQEHLFNLLLAKDGEMDLAKVARAVADLGRATVTQKKWQAEAEEKARKKLDALEESCRKEGRTLDAATLQTVKEALYG